MAVISKLVVELTLQAENFNNQIKAAQKEAKEFEKTIKPTKELTKEWGTALLAVGSAAVIAMGAAVKATADYADNINDLSQKTGVGTEILSKWGFAAEQSGSSLEGVSTGLRFLAKNMELATAGGKQQIAAFAAAGISAKQLAAAGGDVNKILPLLADSFAKSEDGAGKTAVSMALLGKSGTELIPMLNAGSAGLNEMGAAAERAGRVVSAEAAKAADEFNDRLLELTGSMKGIAGAVGNALIPPLTDLITKVTSVVAVTGEWISAHPDLVKWIGAAAVAITGAGGLMLGISALLIALPSLTVAFTVLTGPIGLAVAAVAGLTYAFFKFHDFIKTGVLAVMSAFMTAIGGMISIAEKAARAIGQHGLADQLGIAADAVKFYRDETDKQVVSTMAAIMTIGKTEKALKAEEAARVKTTGTVIKHTMALGDHEKKVKAVMSTYEAQLALEKSLDQATRNLSDIAIPRLSAAMVAVPLPELNTQFEDLELTLRSIKQVQEESIITDTARMGGLRNESEKAAKAAEKDAAAWRNAWSTAMGNVVSGFARGVADMIFEGKSFADSLIGIMKELGKTVVEILVTNAFGNVAKSLSGLMGKIPGLGGILGGGASAAAGAASGASSAAGGASSILSGGISSLSGGLISGGLAAAGSIIGAMMGEGNARRTEENTREARDWLELQTISWDPVFHGQMNFLRDWILPAIVRAGDILWEIRSDVLPNMQAGAGPTFSDASAGRALAAFLVPHLLDLSRNSGMQIVGVR